MVELCSPDVAQPSATVRNRSQPFARGRYGRAFGKLCKRGPFWSFPASHGFISRGRRGDVPTCFMTCQKWFCVAGVILLLRFQKVRCIFRGRRSTLETSDVILRGRHSTLDVPCCVFLANHTVSAARSGDNVQIPWRAWNFVTCDENRRNPRTKR